MFPFIKFLGPKRQEPTQEIAIGSQPRWCCIASAGLFFGQTARKRSIMRKARICAVMYNVSHTIQSRVGRHWWQSLLKLKVPAKHKGWREFRLATRAFVEFEYSINQ